MDLATSLHSGLDKFESWFADSAVADPVLGCGQRSTRCRIERLLSGQRSNDVDGFERSFRQKKTAQVSIRFHFNRPLSSGSITWGLGQTECTLIVIKLLP